MFFKDRLLGLRKMAVLLHEVAAGKLPFIVTSCIMISCVKPKTSDHCSIIFCCFLKKIGQGLN